MTLSAVLWTPALTHRPTLSANPSRVPPEPHSSSLRRFQQRMPKLLVGARHTRADSDPPGPTLSKSIFERPGRGSRACPSFSQSPCFTTVRPRRLTPEPFAPLLSPRCGRAQIRVTDPSHRAAVARRSESPLRAGLQEVRHPELHAQLHLRPAKNPGRSQSQIPSHVSQGIRVP